jgi:uncharacterized SAM-binding protein YcdF (DUF218 family)
MSRAARLRLLVLRALGLVAGVSLLAFLLFLPFAGRFFDHEEPLEKADLIFVLAGDRVERWLEAVDLYKEGWAGRIVLSPGPVAKIEEQLKARGINYPREGDLARAAVIAAGVPPDAVSVLAEPVDNTAQEAAALHRMLAGTLNTRIIVVTSRYHTRRAGFAFRREFGRGSSPLITIRGSRYSSVDPARWWRHRGDVRYIMYEMPKLLAYVAGLGE